MPTEIMYYLRATLQMINGMKWLLVMLFYATVIALFKVYGFILLTIGWAIIAYAYYVDKEREARGMDDFRGGWLFFRYGEQVDRSTISIPVKPEWSSEATALFAHSLRESLTASLSSYLPSEAVQVIGDRPITDQSTGEQKAFLRILIRSRFGSMLTHFVHFAPFGRTITAHLFTYVRGPQNDWELIKFFLLSPLTIWSWSLPWLLNRYSILAEISRYRESSFDGIDLQTMYNLAHRVVLEETERLLFQAGLLTEEVKQALHFHINNKQNINIRNSSSVSLGNINQLTPSPVRT